MRLRKVTIRLPWRWLPVADYWEQGIVNACPLPHIRIDWICFRFHFGGSNA